MPLLHVIKYDGPPPGSEGSGSGEADSWLAWKYPGESIPHGSRLVVGPGQEAVFVNQGHLGDRFAPGTYTLSTQNIPLLQKLVNLPFGGDTPFAAEVYFVNRVAKLDMKWGTADPIRVKDPMYDLIVPVRAYGQFGIRVNDPAAFVLNLVGVLHPDEITMTDRVTRYFRGAVISQVKDAIADLIVTRRVGVLDLPAHLDQIGTACRARIAGEFERFGLEVLNFFVESISVPDNDPSVAALRQALSHKMAVLIEAEAREGARRMDSESQKEEFDLLGDDRYRLKRSFDTMEKAVENQSGPAGTVLDLGIGLGAAEAVGKTLRDIASHTAPPVASQTVPQAGLVPQPSPPAAARCPACGFENPPGARFCAGCGSPTASLAKTCPACRAVNPPGAKFCNSCSNPLT